MKKTLFVFIGIFLFSCQQMYLSPSYTYQIRFYDEITQKPIPNVSVLFSGYVVRSLGGSTINLSLNQKSNENGILTLKFKPVSNATYYKGSFKSDLYYSKATEEIAASQFVPNKKFGNEYFLAQKAKLKIKYIQKKSVEKNNSIFILINSSQSPGGREIVIPNSELNEKTYDVTGSISTKILIVYESNNVEISRRTETIICKPWITNEYVLNY